MNTIYSRIVAKRTDLGGYIKYVFSNLTDGGYIMCVQFPDWNIPLLNVNDEGYLQYKEIIAGIDKWYNSELNQFIPYNYDMVQLIDFIPKGNSEVREIIMT